MTLPSYLLGITLVVAVGMAVYSYFNTEEEQQQNNNQVQRRQRQRRNQEEQPRQRLVRRRTPVRPNRSRCQIPSCENTTSCLCTHCNFHFCAAHNEGDEYCPSCQRHDTIQNFDECCIMCAEEIYDCFLTTCKHIFHRDCLIRWYNNDNQENASCINCRQPFALHHISSDFAAAGGGIW